MLLASIWMLLGRTGASAFSGEILKLTSVEMLHYPQPIVEMSSISFSCAQVKWPSYAIEKQTGNWVSLQS